MPSKPDWYVYRRSILWPRGDRNNAKDSPKNKEGRLEFPENTRIVHDDPGVLYWTVEKGVQKGRQQDYRAEYRQADFF